MTEPSSAAPHQLPPEAQLIQIATGFFAAQAIFVATRLRIPDLLAEGEKNTTTLAEACDADEHSLYRVLRAAASVGVFAELPDRTFANTPISETLRSDHPNSA